MRLFVGGDAGTVQGEKQTLYGDRCFTGAIRPKTRLDLTKVTALLDSGAFTDKPANRLTPVTALERQLKWEAKARDFSGVERWHVEALASYDRLIDETWTGDKRQKKRWSLKGAESAMLETVAAAKYLSEQRERLAPRKLVLAAQGVDSIQYAECADEVLKNATADDWFGFGGWCIIGRNKTMLGEFERTIRLVLPMVKAARVKHVHIFGVLWTPALGRLQWLADQHNITVSTDSSAPVVAMTRKDSKRAGVRRPYWRDNVAWWQSTLANLRCLPEYQAPAASDETIRQFDLFDFMA